MIFQLCVTPGTQRRLVGAALVREVFDRSAYGCKLYCCWCAQDLEANWFWESLGFVPLAFRAGSSGKKRVHIFWERRIDADDAGGEAGGAPYWYPFQTCSGAIRADRLVFPIPPGVHWKDVRAVELPSKEKPKLEDRTPKRQESKQSKAPTFGPPPGKVGIVVGGRIKYIDRPGYDPRSASVDPAPAPAKPKREKKAKVKNDPRHIAAARELRDRWLEELNSGNLLPRGKYDVGRVQALGPPAGESIKILPMVA